MLQVPISPVSNFTDPSETKITSDFSSSNGCQDFCDAVKDCGFVLAGRTSLQCEPYFQEDRLHFKVTLAPNHPAQELVKKGQITPVDAVLIEESECGAGADYTECLCTKDDPEVFQNIKDFKLMGFYWTDTLTRMLGPIE